MTFANNFAGNVYDQYAAAHPIQDFERAIQWFVCRYPALKGKVRDILAGEKIYTGLNFIMRRELFMDWASWIFDLVQYLEDNGDWSDYRDYNSLRCPAYIAERFVNLWLLVKGVRETIKVKEFYRWILVDKVDKLNIAWILSGIKQWLRWKLHLRHHAELPSCVCA